MILQKFLSYLGLGKRQEDNEKPSFNLKVMHGINRISILLFLLALLVMLFRYVIL